MLSFLEVILHNLSSYFSNDTLYNKFTLLYLLTARDINTLTKSPLRKKCLCVNILQMNKCD